MARCETCGNDYEKSFEVIMNGAPHVFDCFECAVFALAPRCASCGVHVIGHGLESHGRIYCCDHCATRAGVTELRDRA